jgi:hypothetical protein
MTESKTEWKTLTAEQIAEGVRLLSVTVDQLKATVARLVHQLDAERAEHVITRSSLDKAMELKDRYFKERRALEEKVLELEDTNKIGTLVHQLAEKNQTIARLENHASDLDHRIRCMVADSKPQHSRLELWGQLNQTAVDKGIALDAVERKDKLLKYVSAELRHFIRAPSVSMTEGADRKLSSLIRDVEKETTPNVCKVPPPGWSCSRVAGHEGPCAARAKFNLEDHKGGKCGGPGACGDCS